MKKILIQLDSDKFPSTFDCIVAHDSGADDVLSYGGVTPTDVRPLILSAFFTRGIPDLKNLAAWIGGSDVSLGEQILAEAQRTFFGPFKISLVLDSNGCNTTASTAIAKLAGQTDLPGKEALVIGPGPLGVRSAVLLACEGGRIRLVSIPPQLLGDRYNPELAKKTLASARKSIEGHQTAKKLGEGSIEIEEIAGLPRYEDLVRKAEIVIAAGPAGLQLLSRSLWMSSPTLKWVVDFNLTEPLGVEGVKPSDDFAAYEDKRVLGALAIGNPKMKVQKTLIGKVFERNDLVLDTEGVYQIAKGLV